MDSLWIRVGYQKCFRENTMAPCYGEREVAEALWELLGWLRASDSRGAWARFTYWG